MKKPETEPKLERVPGGPEDGGRPVSVTAYAKPKKYPVKKLIFAIAIVVIIAILFIFKQ